MVYEDTTIDHIFPLAAGGNHHETNVQVTCLRCNQEKAAKTDEIVETVDKVRLRTPRKKGRRGGTNGYRNHPKKSKLRPTNGSDKLK